MDGEIATTVNRSWRALKGKDRLAAALHFAEDVGGRLAAIF